MTRGKISIKCAGRSAAQVPSLFILSEVLSLIEGRSRSSRGSSPTLVNLSSQGYPDYSRMRFQSKAHIGKKLSNIFQYFQPFLYFFHTFLYIFPNFSTTFDVFKHEHAHLVLPHSTNLAYLNLSLFNSKRNTKNSKLFYPPLFFHNFR
jgi:hypothetical protein